MPKPSPDFDALDIEQRKHKPTSLTRVEHSRVQTLAVKAIKRLHPDDWAAARQWATEQVLAERNGGAA